MITPIDLCAVPLLRDCSDSETAAIALAAADVQVHAGEWLVQEGDTPAFFMILSGALQLTKSHGGVERELNQWNAGDYFGEVPLLLGSPFIINLRATTDTRLAKLSGNDFFDLIMPSPSLSPVVVQTMAKRVSMVQEYRASTPIESITVYGPVADPNCYLLRQFLSGNELSFRWRNIDSTSSIVGSARAAPPEAVTGPYPVVVYSDGSVACAPTIRQIADRTGLQTVPKSEWYDVVIIGGGPAGLAAAVYGASEGLSTLMLERQAPGGQAGTSSRIENYLGFPSGLSGGELASRALQQAKRFGAEVVVTRSVRGVQAKPGQSSIILEDGSCVCARTIILATGVTWRELDVPGASELVGRGIYYGAARTEAMSVRGRNVFLIGGGNSAGQAAMFFADYARQVTLLVRADDIAKGMSQYLINQLATKCNIAVCVNSSVVEVCGESHLDAITVETRDSGEPGAHRQRFETEALFAFIGADAKTDWLPDEIGRDARGFILTGRDAFACGKWPLERDPYLLETSLPGVFAVGDVRHDSIKRVASGVGEGSMSIAYVHQYLADISAKHA